MLGLFSSQYKALNDLFMFTGKRDFSETIIYFGFVPDALSNLCKFVQEEKWIFFSTNQEQEQNSSCSRFPALSKRSARVVRCCCWFWAFAVVGRNNYFTPFYS